MSHGSKVTPSFGIKARSPLECWGCGGDHLHRFCPQQGRNEMTAHNIQVEATTKYVARGIPKINASLENHQDDHQ